MADELILIVEDDDSSRMLLRDVLEVKGYRTMASETAEEGIALAQLHHPALILMDIHLPGMSGIDALRSLRAGAGTRDIPVIAVSASVMKEQQHEAMTAGFDAFERKPISVADILRIVREVLDRSTTPRP
jgi:two-component system cell cycle response regulator DivK